MLLKQLLIDQLKHLEPIVELIMVSLGVAFIYFIILAIIAVGSFMRFQSKLDRLSSKNTPGKDAESTADQHFNVKNRRIQRNLFNTFLSITLFRTNKSLASAWVDYKKSLSNTGDDDRRTANQSAENIFQPSAIVDQPLFLDFYKHLPGLFTATGILGTFGGIILGLMAFNISGDASNARHSLEILLSNVKDAFVLSAIAIVLAVASTLIEKVLATILLNQNTKLCHTLDSIFELINESKHIYETAEHTGKMKNDTELMLACMQNIENILMHKTKQTVFAALAQNHQQSLNAFSTNQSAALANLGATIISQQSTETANIIHSISNAQQQASIDGQAVVTSLNSLQTSIDVLTKTISAKLSSGQENLTNENAAILKKLEQAAETNERLSKSLTEMSRKLSTNLMGSSQAASNTASDSEVSIYSLLSDIKQSSVNLNQAFDKDSLSNTFSSALSGSTQALTNGIQPILEELSKIKNCLPTSTEVDSLAQAVKETASACTALQSTAGDESSIPKLIELVNRVQSLATHVDSIAINSSKIQDANSSLTAWNDASINIKNSADNVKTIVSHFQELQQFNPEKMKTSMAGMAQKMADNVSDSYSQSVLEIDTKVNDIKRIIEDLSKVSINNNLITALNTLANSTEAITKTSANLLTLSESATSLSTTLNLDTMESLGTAVIQARDTFADISIESNKTLHNLGEVNKTLKEQVSAGNQLSTSLNVSSKCVSDLTGNLSSMSKLAHETNEAATSLATAASEVKKFSDNISNAAAEVGKASKSLGETQSTVLNELQKVGTGVGDFSNHVGTALDNLTTALSGIKSPPK